MSSYDLVRTIRSGEIFHSRRAVFGPFLVLHTVPWLFLAGALRLNAKGLGGIAGLIVMVLVEYALVIAFLLASHRLIQLAGGVVHLERLPFKEQFQLTRSVVWRVLAFFFVAVLCGLALGLDKHDAATLWFGFDNIFFPWPGTYLPFLSALTAVFVFVMVVEKGLGRPPTYRAAFREIAKRWQYLGLAGLMITVMFYGFNIVQIYIPGLLQPLYEALAAPFLRNAFFLSLVFFFSYLRLLITVNILTMALRASYRQNAA